MKLFLTGIGQAGGNLMDLLVEPEGWLSKEIPAGVVGGLALNTAEKDLEGLEFMGEKNSKRQLFGTEYVGATGVGAKWNLARQAAEKEIDEITDSARDVGILDADAILVSLGMGGGTGCGAAPAVVKGYKSMMGEIASRALQTRGREEDEGESAVQTLPVFAIGVLPSRSEPMRFRFNTYCAMANLIGNVENHPDGLLVVDNDVIFGLKARQSEEAERGEEKTLTTEEIMTVINPRIGESIKLMLMTGVNPSNFVIDAADCQSTMWAQGMTGLCVPGYAKMNLKTGKEVITIKDLVKDAVTHPYDPKVKNGLLCDCDYRSALKALIIVGGPSDALEVSEIEEARDWLESQIAGVDVRVGDAVVPGDDLEVLVILTGPKIPKLDSIFNDFELYGYTNIGDLNREDIDSEDLEGWKDKMSDYFKTIRRTREIMAATE